MKILNSAIKKKKKSVFLFSIVLSIIIITYVFAIEAVSANKETEELPVPLNFIGDFEKEYTCDLIESITFDLSENNLSQVYYPENESRDLIFSFEDVSGSINFALKMQNGEIHKAGFSGGNNAVYANINLEENCQFEYTLGFVELDSEKVSKEFVDSVYGKLNIYEVISSKK